jgi:choline dehydrogenase-like flavoprotein
VSASTQFRGDRGGAFDVVIIGSGAGGSTLACQLTARGLKVLLVERGARMTPRAQAQPIGRFLYHEVTDPAKPLSYVGGQTKFYGAALYRFRESDFDEVAHENGISPAWPIRYADLEPYYEAAERLYRVHGAPDGDPTEPPRANPYPYPPLPQDGLIARFAQNLRRSGTSTASIPRGLDYRAGGACVMCPTCDAHYCQLDAKMDAETAALAQAMATGNLHLLSGVECLRVLTGPAGETVRGVELRGRNGDEIVECPIVAVSAGLPGSAALLRRSRNEHHPQGLGNHGGALGKYLAGHATGMVFPFVSLRQVPPTHTKDFAINEYYHGAPDWPYPLGVIQTGGQTPFWEVASRLQRPLAKVIGQHSIICFYMAEALPTAESGLVFDCDTIKDRVPPIYNMASFAKLRALTTKLFRKAGYLSLARRKAPYLWHETGTARMGDDPATSVVDRNCQVHGIDGLYVMDASVLPTAGAVNTGLTIMALALRAGDHIATGRVGGARIGVYADPPDPAALLC